MNTNLSSLESTDIVESPREPRRNQRFLPDTETPPVRFTNSLGQLVEGELANESYSGVAALVASADGLEIGQQANVDYFGFPIPGVIRRLMEQPSGEWLVGIEWK
ncbi:MAG TPA: hypothetical protein VL096_03250 [Pirellulaceae bacterium]|nr:hypothetical protein [Pirellulaceae bacterium]